METRAFHSTITIRNLTNNRGPAPLRSLSNMALLEILQDHEIEVAASGDDAHAALEKISQLVESGMGEALTGSQRQSRGFARENKAGADA